MPDLRVLDPRRYLPLVEGERSDLAAFLRTMAPAQWDHETLCEGWSVRDVVAHVVSFDDVSPLLLPIEFARAGLSVDRFNDTLVRRYRDRTPGELLDALERIARPRGGGRLLGPGALTDAVIHHQDIRRPLGEPRDVPADRLVLCLTVLRELPTGAGGLRRARGLRLVATDLDWNGGDGPEVRGPGEALLMGIAGRAVALPELNGDGKAILAGRMPG